MPARPLREKKVNMAAETGFVMPALASLPWMGAAMGEFGVSPFAPGQSNPRITAYHHGTSLHGYDDKVAWCSSFVHWCLGQACIKGTGSGLARSWLDWGEPLDAPLPGCIVVLSRDDPDGWKGHVGFYLHFDADHVHLLGGNQLEQVRAHFYPISSVLAYRWPAGLACTLPSQTTLPAE